MSRLVARFGVDTAEGVMLYTRYEHRLEKILLDPNRPVAESLLTSHPAANWFERKVAEDFGVYFANSYDRRPLQRHAHIAPNQFVMRQGFQSEQLAEQPPQPYPYEGVTGSTVYEIAVGPIHAGIIEPGHFHFSQAGEFMLHQEVRHFYKYRAIEKMLQGKTPEQAWPIVSRISGHSSVAWQWAFAQAVITASGQENSQSAQRQAALLLELERLAHHLTDLGFIPNDAGFGAALAWSTSLAEQTRRHIQQLTGHRFAFDALLQPLTLDSLSLKQFIDTLRDELARFQDWIEEIPSLWDRLDTTGKLKPEWAKQYGVVGVMARASGVALDVRAQDAFYHNLGFEMQRQKKGDVAARFSVRLAEALHSLFLLEQLLSTSQPFAPIDLPKQIADSAEGEGWVESALGELYCWCQLESGRIRRFYARDPSFINWQALHLMMPGNIIADFPLINKSCDLSYAGNDL